MTEISSSKLTTFGCCFASKFCYHGYKYKLAKPVVTVCGIYIFGVVETMAEAITKSSS